ncbi:MULTISPECIES: hypothetical protein [Pseudomonadaceae]|uniref:hypothetical protein n=1 Tax=Pseudomonadaceae TaxID=135621 RepID=UPI0010397E17|nr:MULTISPECIES: hypothetical protein [Pseudomonadaceae]MCQ4260971.1 hypothetical protein [Stutzerimonas stutzeri]TCD19191.1 hypothetical protein E0D86_19480 [Pseudomonas sp. IC_126]
MDRLIKENLEALLKEAAGTKRLGRRIINLAGFLGTAEIPAGIQIQLNELSRLLILHDAFDALLEPITLLSRADVSRMLDTQALVAMISSLEASRQAIADTGTINYAELITWLVGQAQSRRILRLKNPASGA